MIFDPYPPTVGSFILLSVSKSGKFLIPPPLNNADVLNGWSPSLPSTEHTHTHTYPTSVAKGHCMLSHPSMYNPVLTNIVKKSF